MSILRGDIYWLEFGPPRGSTQGGHRPALIIQNDEGNKYSPTTIVAAITSALKQSYPFHVEVAAAESGLSRNSTILLEQIRTIDQSLLGDKAGRLSKAKMTEVDEAIKTSLGC